MTSSTVNTHIPRDRSSAVNIDAVTQVPHDDIEQCGNWGRRGDDDEIGTLNIVGPEQVRAAVAMVRPLLSGLVIK